MDQTQYYIGNRSLGKSEAVNALTQHVSIILKLALEQISGEDTIAKQIDICNQLITLLRERLQEEDFQEDIIDTNGRILTGIFNKLNLGVSDVETYIREMTPYTGLIQSELFTGSNVAVSLESEIRKEILSADEIRLLVSFIKWSGLRIIAQELKEFTEKGGRLKVITTTYMGATDFRAVEFLANLKNTEVKVSYNEANERLHAKAYLFLRDTGFHTAYIGSSNVSRSALTSGLEWNIKVTTKEIPHIINKFLKTFDTYWLDNEFAAFTGEAARKKLIQVLNTSRTPGATLSGLFFDLKPFAFQEEILEKLEVERSLHGRFRNLVVAATGTGKTLISAFDFRRHRIRRPDSRLLFIAHRKEILQQARQTFQHVLRDANFGDLWVDGMRPQKFEAVFASVQSLNNELKALPLTSDYYTYIVIDEVHHIAANSYRPILERFQSEILLGLTATPERTDGEDIVKDFCHVAAAEIRLPEAINRRLLCSFQYFGISDTIDLTPVSWKNGKYVPSELSKLYTGNDRRVGEIISNLQNYLTDLHDVRALGFCVSQEHAQFMAEKFLLAGINADYLVSGRSDQRDELRLRLEKKEINYLFVVDMFNEGVDIPAVDTVLFLRPTESLIVFLQQLGRGLRHTPGKELLTVLDFVGNARQEYDFQSKFRALIGKTNTSLLKEIEDDFPHLPLGCSIILEKKAKDVILRNIRQAISSSRSNLIQKISGFHHQTTLPLTLRNFASFYHLDLQTIYVRDGWNRLCVKAGCRPDYESLYENEILRAIRIKWLTSHSATYFRFIRQLAQVGFNVQPDNLTETERAMCLMLYYDVWQENRTFPTLREAIQAIGHNRVLVDEISEVLGMLIDNISFMEHELSIPYEQPLKVHARYTRDQIFAALGVHTFERKKTSREGVLDIKEKNTELFFITLDKSEGNFSPTTMYQDFALSETIFHWQSQNATRPDKGKGREYVHHKRLGKRILLFVRERNADEFGNTMGYVLLGEGSYVSHSGSKPMSIQWELSHPIPPYLWKDSAKMAVG